MILSHLRACYPNVPRIRPLFSISIPLIIYRESIVPLCIGIVYRLVIFFFASDSQHARELWKVVQCRDQDLG